MIDETHDPLLRSWIASANGPSTDFPIQNLPFCVFRGPSGGERPRVGVAIGDHIADVVTCADIGAFDGEAAIAAASCDAPSLNALMQLGQIPARALRNALSGFLREDSSVVATDSVAAKRALVPMADVVLEVPAAIGDYSDFYASIHHATNVGSMFRPDNPLLPNYKWVPIGYHGRASSIVASGTTIRRPAGQTRDGVDGPPSFGPTRRLDYEVEIGCFIGRGTALGAPISIDDAEEQIFGLCLVNDWSARDIQAWEYQPLGPFLAKSFATTISPWVVTADALAPFRCAAADRPVGDPGPLPYLNSENAKDAGIDLTVEAWIASAAMRGAGIEPQRVSRGHFAEMYWTFAQLVTHHDSGGCNLSAGDLIASGTISGPTNESRGCLLERTWRGTDPIQLPTGERRAFLEDGDEVILRAYAERDGYRRIGFGECRGRISSAAVGPA
ncbi:MAG TPA: fumarylacetoacetase [Gemmatimonadaceae bacterium]|nr:fumarylacetoacetase [Gemmatimonadaceae bacterium]